MIRVLRRFYVTSLACMVAAAVVLGLFYRHIATSQLLEMGERNNVVVAQIFANSIWPQYRSFAESVGRVDADRLREHPDIAKLRQSVFDVMRNTQVVKVKLYENEGRTLFSTDPAQIGKDYSANPGFISAQKGKPLSELTHRDKFSAFDRELERRDVLSSYVPMRPNAGAPIEGVLEIYSDVTDLLQNVERQVSMVVLIVIGVLALLYGALILVARSAELFARRQAAPEAGAPSMERSSAGPSA
jgi:hypothetical protein